MPRPPLCCSHGAEGLPLSFSEMEAHFEGYHPEYELEQASAAVQSMDAFHVDRLARAGPTLQGFSRKLTNIHLAAGASHPQAALLHAASVPDSGGHGPAYSCYTPIYSWAGNDARQDRQNGECEHE